MQFHALLYCFVVSYSGLKYLCYLRPFISKVYKTLLFRELQSYPLWCTIYPLPSPLLPPLLVLFQRVSFIREIPSKQSPSKLFESINNWNWNLFFQDCCCGWRNGSSKTTETFKQVSWDNSSHPGKTVGFDFRGKYLMYHKLYWFTFF